jgi:hypothetical protein
MLWGLLFYGLFYGSYYSFVLWRHGEAAIVLPITKYETFVDYKEGTREILRTRYVADLSVRLSSGEVVVIPRKPIDMELIEGSRQRKIGIMVHPENPKFHRFVRHESVFFPAFKFFLLTCVVSFISFIWFRRRS